MAAVYTVQGNSFVAEKPRLPMGSDSPSLLKNSCTNRSLTVAVL